METSNEFRLLEHKFWKEVLAMPNRGTNKLLKKISMQDLVKKKCFLSLIVQSFYSISSSSPLSFRRVYELSDKEETKDIARKIYETELGEHPLVPDSKYNNIPHKEQFVLTIESLISGIKLFRPKREI